jgi:hypothetical protein
MYYIYDKENWDHIKARGGTPKELLNSINYVGTSDDVHDRLDNHRHKLYADEKYKVPRFLEHLLLP